MDARQIQGKRAEAWVAEQLTTHGLRIRAQGLRTPYAEIDLLAEHIAGPEHSLIVIEVKSHHENAWLRGEDLLRPPQRRRLARALQWLAERLDWRGELRLDLVDVRLEAGRPVSFDWLRAIEVPDPH